MKFVVFCCLGFLAACAKQPSQIVLGGPSMGTSWSAKLIAVDHPLSSAELNQQVQQRLNDIEAKMSNWKSDSDVSRFNRMGAGCMAVSPETASVVQQGLVISEQSEGAFDMTLGPLIELWGFGKRIGSDQVPAASEIHEALAQTGYQGISVEEGQLCKTVGDLQINVSAIAKGYGVDQAAKAIEDLGYENYLVEVGGELYGKGHSLRQKPWAIGVEQPVADKRAVMDNVIIALSQHGLATSGDYRIFFERDGKRYSHLLDPTTGYPVNHQVASVTVLADSSMIADAYATTLQVMGIERALRLANKLGLQVMVLEYAAEEQIVAYYSETWPY